MQYETLTNADLMQEIEALEREDDRMFLVYGDYENVVPSRKLISAIGEAIRRGLPV